MPKTCLELLPFAILSWDQIRQAKADFLLVLLVPGLRAWLRYWRSLHLDSGRGRSFFLTSLLIELINPSEGVSRFQTIMASVCDPGPTDQRQKNPELAKDLDGTTIRILLISSAKSPSRRQKADSSPSADDEPRRFHHNYLGPY